MDVDANLSLNSQHKPVVIITIGMAGSGKTTFVQRLNSHLNARQASDKTVFSAPYIVNLDPAVSHMPFEANIDIRDTVDYSEVMKQYNLGPNGGILTALNLFTTKFDQVLNLIEKRADSVDYVILDTPGQIEIFTWSASGAIITDAVAATLPTVVAYIIDTPRTTAPATFMSNMLYACSILYKTKLPFVLVFNKTDVHPHTFATEWMTDFEAFQKALAAYRQTQDGDGDSNYMDSLMHSMSLVLDEFYQHLKSVGVSSLTGDGMDEFLNAVQEARKEYESEYLPELERLRKDRDAQLQAAKQDSIDRLMKDLNVEEEERRARGLPNQREQWDEDENVDDAEDLDMGGATHQSRFMDMRRARRNNDDMDDTVWPRPG
ncbi:hypothetical protein FRC03_004191 [Tulasnella sp. 419]|nr:hypothetical protein FRC03_004191 [Tulasnella sp. 419]